MAYRIPVYVVSAEDTIISSIFCEQDSLSPQCREVINLVKELTTILQANSFREDACTKRLRKLEARGVTLNEVRGYLLCNLTLRETLSLNLRTRDCWILALQRMGFTKRQIADAIQLGQHFAGRCRADDTLDPLTLVTNTILHHKPPAGLPLPIPTF